MSAALSIVSTDFGDASLPAKTLHVILTSKTVEEAVASPTNITPFPALPSELVIHVFEIAAEDCKVIAATLALVSRAVRAVVLPFLFRTLVMRRRRRAHALGYFLHTHTYAASQVRAVWMRESTSTDYIHLVPCARVARLAVLPGCLSALCGYGDRLHDSLRGDSLETTRFSLCTPRELLVFPGCIDWRDFNVSAGYTRAFFEGLTHLWLTQPSQIEALMDCRDAVSALSRLTHLATPLTVLSPKIQEILNTFPALQSFIITVPSPYKLDTCLWYPRTVKDWTVDNNLRYLHDKRVYAFRFPDQKADDAILSLWKEGKDSIWNSVKVFRGCS
ncbi:hypothetical protein DFH11DRAFT_358511 [Phellopilus nigrolimitatus]|nr:hypothetical protein DFH11DRAFT_358511 [Phellopilus nigrolimitatus]